MTQTPPAHIERLFAAALSAHRDGKLGDAEPLYRQVLEADSGHADALHMLGVLAQQSGRSDLAVELIRRAIARNERAPSFHNNLGNALNALGRTSEAEDCYRRALALRADHVEAHYNLGVVLQAQGRLEEAAASYRHALSLRPSHAAALGNLGNTLQALGRLDAAVAAYRRALLHRPDFAEAHGNLGNVLAALGQPAEAAGCYERALALRPGYAQAHYNLGNLRLEQGRLEEAAGCYRRTIALQPDHAAAYTNLGNALKEQGNAAEALECYARALTLDPHSAEARLGRAMGVIPVFAVDAAESAAVPQRFERALEELRTWDRAHPGTLGTAAGKHQPFYLAYRPADVTAPLSRYGELLCAATAANDAPRVPARPSAAGTPRSKVRLLIVSGHVRAHHPVWEIIVRGLIAHLDRGRFELALLHTGPGVDAQAQWAAAHVDHCVHGPKAVTGWLDEIARLAPEVIFHPEVGMDPITCTLAARRLAPLQIAGWGHPVTTGLPTIDLYMSGELLEAPDAGRHYSEQLVRLPGTGVCTAGGGPEAQRWSTQRAHREIVRFALCQQPIKFDPVDDALLARIAAAAGPCELWLAAPARLGWATQRLEARLAAAFRAAGLDPVAHLRVTPWLPPAQFSGFLDEMDIFLDCPAFSGYSTARQALQRGLPIVTVEGAFMRQRLAAGLLRQIGWNEGIAATREEYCATAVRLAQERRGSGGWSDRRARLQQAAHAADGNQAAVRAFGEKVLEALGARRLSG